MIFAPVFEISFVRGLAKAVAVETGGGYYGRMLPGFGDTRRKPPWHLRKREAPPIFEYAFRPAKRDDLGDLREIYNHYVTNSAVTFDEKPSTLTYWREKFDLLEKLGLPIIVAVSPNDSVLGYALVQPLSAKTAYRYSVENSIYLGPGATGKGLGLPLLETLIAACREAGLREVIAVISDSGADASIKLHKNAGFKEVGRMGAVGYKFGRPLGTVTMQLSLKQKRAGRGRFRALRPAQ